MSYKELKQILEECEGYSIKFKETLAGHIVAKVKYGEFGRKFAIKFGINCILSYEL